MILVTGGTGMLGSHILYKLLKKGFKVRATKRSTSNTNETLNVFSFYEEKPNDLFDRIEWVDTDLYDTLSILDTLKNVDIIFHAAAIISFNPAEKEATIKNNTKITANIVDAALHSNIKKFIHISSIAAIGKAKNYENLITEKDELDNLEKKSAYSVSKFKSELEVWRAVAEGLNAVILNPSVIIGAGNWKKGSPSMISLVDKGFKYFTNGGTGFVDVNDVAEIAIILSQKNISGERYIINSQNLTFKYVFSEIAKNLEKKPPYIFASNFKLQSARFLEMVKYKILRINPKITKDTIASATSVSKYSSNKIIDEINFKFTNISSSVKQTCNIYKKYKY